MFRAINEYLAKINVVTDQSMYEAMSSFLEKTKLVDNFSINALIFCRRNWNNRNSQEPFHLIYIN